MCFLCFAHFSTFQTSSDVSRRKNLLERHNKVAKQLFNFSFKKIQKQPLEVFYKKVFLKFLQTSRESTLVGVFFFLIAGLQPGSFFKKDLRAFQHKCFPVKFAKLLRTPKNIFKQLLLEASMKKAALKNFTMFTRQKQLAISGLCKRCY